MKYCPPTLDRQSAIWTQHWPSIKRNPIHRKIPSIHGAQKYLKTIFTPSIDAQVSFRITEPSYHVNIVVRLSLFVYFSTTIILTQLVILSRCASYVLA